MGQTNMAVELLRYTDNPEETVAMAAKLCYSPSDIAELKEGIEAGDQSKFIDRLISMGHLSPVEHISFTFAIEGVSRSLLAQITRHRIASFSVQSQRYVKASSEDTGETFDYIIPPSIENLGEEYVTRYREQMATIQAWYDQWVDALGDKGESTNEDARFVLPNAAETKMIVTMNGRELMHFFKLRCCNRAQWEIRELATEMLRLVKEVAPNIFKNAGPSCVGGKCSEGSMTCGKAAEVREKFKKL